MSGSNWQERTALLIGDAGVSKLQRAHILVAGLGGVGGYAAEMLCRAGIGKLTIVDSDIVQSGNRNRQLIAMTSTLARNKTDVFRQRLMDINPDLDLVAKSDYLMDHTIDEVLDNYYDYIVDAIDTLTPKVQLLYKAKMKEFPVVSSMGSGGKFDPEMIKIADISESHHCKFAFTVRKCLRKYNVHTGIKVVFSPEMVNKSAVIETIGEQNKKSIVGTISYMPSIFGCFCASVVIRDILK